MKGEAAWTGARLGWIKAHVGIIGNEETDQLTKEGIGVNVRRQITEGGLKQAWERKGRGRGR